MQKSGDVDVAGRPVDWSAFGPPGSYYNFGQPGTTPAEKPAGSGVSIPGKAPGTDPWGNHTVVPNSQFNPTVPNTAGGGGQPTGVQTKPVNPGATTAVQPNPNNYVKVGEPSVNMGLTAPGGGTYTGPLGGPGNSTYTQGGTPAGTTPPPPATPPATPPPDHPPGSFSNPGGSSLPWLLNGASDNGGFGGVPGSGGTDNFTAPTATTPPPTGGGSPYVPMSSGTDNFGTGGGSPYAPINQPTYTTPVMLPETKSATDPRSQLTGALMRRLKPQDWYV